MTIPQARLLQKHFADNDGQLGAARLIVESIVDIAVAGGLIKRAEKPFPASRRPDTDAAAALVPDTLIPELRTLVEAQLRTEGWQPPKAGSPQTSDFS